MELASDENNEIKMSSSSSSREKANSDDSKTLVFTTENGHGQSVKFSPFSPNRLAVAVGSEYGLQGLGYIYILERNEGTGELEEVLQIDYNDSILDACWSEKDSNIFVTGAGDGLIHVWNMGNKYPKVSIHEFRGHKKEISSVDWNLSKFSNCILSASWDGHVFCYDLTSQWPLLKMTVSELIVYQAVWSPHQHNNYISCSSDGILQLWDMNANASKAQVYLSASDTELLSCDWSKYYPFMVATAGSDSVVRIWDLRNYSSPIASHDEHGQAIKKVKFSPFHQTLIATASYDFTIRLFDYQISVESSLERIDHHSEFVYGVDWNLHKKNELVSTAFDKTVKIFTPSTLRGT